MKLPFLDSDFALARLYVKVLHQKRGAPVVLFRYAFGRRFPTHGQGEHVAAAKALVGFDPRDPLH